MSAELAAQGDWTATVEQAVAVEIVRRRRWLRAYLALVLAVTLATLALVWLQRDGSAAQVARQLEPVTASTQRLTTQQVALARHQMDLAERLTRLEAQAAALTEELSAGQAAARAAEAAAEQARRRPPPAAPALAAPATTVALARVAARQDRLDGSVGALQQRLQRLEAIVAPATGRDAGRDAAIDARFDRLTAALRALEAATRAPAPGAAPAPAADAAAQRLEAIDRRLGRLERTAVRAGAASAD